MKDINNGLKQSSSIEITRQTPKKAQRGKIEKKTKQIAIGFFKLFSPVSFQNSNVTLARQISLSDSCDVFIQSFFFVKIVNL